MKPELWRCAHPHCGCATRGRTGFCGRQCMRAAQRGDLSCRCGHLNCNVQNAGVRRIHHVAKRAPSRVPAPAAVALTKSVEAEARKQKG